MPPTAETRSSALSRRSLMVAAAAGAVGPFSGLATPLADRADAATLPMIRPKSSQKAWESFGVCAFPTHDKTSYRYRSAWVPQLASLGVSYIRGAYAHGFAPTYEAVRLLRANRMRWGMPVISGLDMSDDALRARIADIAAKAADVCLYVEGINEPNYNRGGGRVPADWKERTLHKQQVLWQAVRSHRSLSHAKVLGPSLQTNVVTTNDYKWFGAHGLFNYMTHAGSHCYPAGAYPDEKFDSMLGPVRSYMRRPIWITETGYNNALATKSGARPVPEDIAALYAPIAVLEAVDRGMPTTWFEALDAPDAGAKDDIEANFGLMALKSGIAPPWRVKPVASSLRTVLTSMKDPGPAYTPRAIGLRVSAPVSDVRWTALAKRDGRVTLHLRRRRLSYDPIRKTRLSVPAVPVTITTARGSRKVSVGARLVSVQL